MVAWFGFYSCLTIEAPMMIVVLLPPTIHKYSGKLVTLKLPIVNEGELLSVIVCSENNSLQSSCFAPHIQSSYSSPACLVKDKR